MDFKIPINDISAEDNWVFKSNSWDVDDKYTYSIPRKYPSKPSVDIKRLNSINKLNDKIKRHASLKQEISTISSTMFFGNEENNKDEKFIPNNTYFYKNRIKSNDNIIQFPQYSEEDKKNYYHKNDISIELRHSSSSESDDSLSEIYLQRHYPIQKNFLNNEGYKEKNFVRRHKTLDNVHLQKNYYNYVRPTYTKARRSQSYHYPRQYQNLTINTENLNCNNYSLKKNQPKMLRRDTLYYDICDICSKTHKSNEKCLGYSITSPSIDEQIFNKTYLSQNDERTLLNYNNHYLSHNSYIKPFRSRSPQILKPDTLYYKLNNTINTTTNTTTNNNNKNNDNNHSQNFINLLENNDIYKNIVKNDSINNQIYYSNEQGIISDNKSQFFQHTDNTVIKPANAGPAWKLKTTNINEIPRHPSPIFRYGNTQLPKSLYDYDFYANEMKKKAAEKKTRTIIAIVVCLIAFIIIVCAGIILASTYK